MGVYCELCAAPAAVYCEADRACVCWACDLKVHSANFLANRHVRTLLCYKCGKCRVPTDKFSITAEPNDKPSLSHECGSPERQSPDVSSIFSPAVQNISIYHIQESAHEDNLCENSIEDTETHDGAYSCALTATSEEEANGREMQDGSRNGSSISVISISTCFCNHPLSDEKVSAPLQTPESRSQSGESMVGRKRRRCSRIGRDAPIKLVQMEMEESSLSPLVRERSAP